jgi:hypothetical protein
MEVNQLKYLKGNYMKNILLIRKFIRTKGVKVQIVPRHMR